MRYIYPNELYHYGILGMHWGIRRYQNPDGSLTEAGKKRLAKNLTKQMKLGDRLIGRELLIGNIKTQQKERKEKVSDEKNFLKRLNAKYEIKIGDDLLKDLFNMQVDDLRSYEKSKKIVDSLANTPYMKISYIGDDLLKNTFNMHQYSK